MSKNKLSLISFYFYNLFVYFCFSLVCYLVLIHITIFVLFTVSFPWLIALVSIFIFRTHCPASNRLASCGQYFCSVICLIINFCRLLSFFVVVCCLSFDCCCQKYITAQDPRVNRVTPPTGGPPPPCKQVLSYREDLRKEKLKTVLRTKK